VLKQNFNFYVLLYIEKNGQIKIKSKEKIFEHTVSSKIAFIKLYSILYIPYTQSKK